MNLLLEDLVHQVFVLMIVVRYQNLALCLLSIPALGYFSLLTVIQFIKPPLTSESTLDNIVNKGINILFYIGISLGLIICTPLADRYGRKKLILAVCCAACPLGIYAFIGKDNFDFSIIMLLCGCCCGTYYGVCVTYITEIASSSYTTIYFSLFHLAWPVSSYLAFVAFVYVKEWALIVLLACCPPLLLLPFSRLMAESPNFLIARGEYTEAAADANKIVAVNTDKRAEIDINETILYFKEFIDFDSNRMGVIYQYPLLWNYKTSRAFLLVFGQLMFLTFFTFSGLLQLSAVLDLNYYFPSFFIVAIFFSILIRKTFKARSFTSFLLFMIFIIGSICAIVMLYMRIVHDFAAAFLCVLSFITVLKSIMLAATCCPCRVRATGFGFAVGVGVIGGMLGSLLGKYSDSTILFFSLSAVLSSAFLKKTKKIEVLNKGCNDIYEIFENKHKHSTHLITMNNSSFYTAGRESNIKHISMIELGSELESCSDFLPPTTTCEHFIEIPLDGSVHGLEDIKCIKVYRNGFLAAEGNDSKGQYVVDGYLEGFKYFRFSKKRNDALEILYTGERIASIIVGRWKDHAQEGDFKWSLQMNRWGGNITTRDAQKAVTWLINIKEDTIIGIVLLNEDLKIMKGYINGNKITFQVIDSQGRVVDFEGEINGNNVVAKHGDDIKVNLCYTQSN